MSILGIKEIIEISKPRIVVLLVITAVTSMYAASKLIGPELDTWGLIHIIIAGGLASAGSSALNHYYDRDIDPLMERTSTRPIPSGRIKPNSVLIYGLAVSVISVVYGALALNYVSAFFIALGIFFYVIIYTAWLKRLNSSNIVIGGRVIEQGSTIMNKDSDIIGGEITFYGKTKKNFSANKYGNCQWVVGCNFGVRRDYLLEIDGFDKNYKGNAMLEDCDFCFNVKKCDGMVLFSPKPTLEHLRVPTGGTRQLKNSKGMYYRAHNTVYFFRKYGKRRFLFFVFLFQQRL